MDKTGEPSQRNVPSAFGVLLSISGLWSLGIAYPIFGNITSGPEGLTMIHADWLDVVLLVALILVLPPIGLTLLVLIARRLGVSHVALIILGLILGALSALLLWQYLNLASPLDLIVPLLGGVLVTVLVVRTVFLRNFFSFLGLATPTVLALFLVTPQVSTEILPDRKVTNEVLSTGDKHRDTSVVLVIFDELPLAAITNSKGQIDGDLFPNLARLANRATFYPNLLSSARSTNQLLPAIMTGNRPTSASAPASAKRYPSNLCRTLRDAGWKVRSVESGSRFCNRYYPRRQRFETALSIGISGGAFPEFLYNAGSNALMPLESQARPAYQRKQNLEGFLNGLGSGGGRFEVHHALIPHSPWNLNEIGNIYQEPAIDPSIASDQRSQRLAKEVEFQLMMVMSRYLDEWVGRLMIRIEENGDWDETMLIVMADHGRAFRGTGNSRIPTSQTAADNLNPPLLIKYPKQKEGKVDQRLARSVDIAPTVLAALDVEIDGVMLGKDLRSPQVRSDSSTVTVWDDPDPYRYSREELRKSASTLARQRDRLFGSGTLYALGGAHRRLGTSTNERAIASRVEAKEKLGFFFGVPGANSGGFEAEVSGKGVRVGRSVGITYGGELLATTRVWRRSNGRFFVSAVLPLDGAEQREPGKGFEVVRLGW